MKISEVAKHLGWTTPYFDDIRSHLLDYPAYRGQLPANI